MKPFWSGFLLSFSLCLDLGIVNVAILRTSLQQGGSAGFLLGVGSCLGDMVYFAMAVLGAAALLEWPPVRLVLWIFGTAILLYLAWRMAREVVRPRHLELTKSPAVAPAGPLKLVATGAGLAMTSPTGILWFVAVGGSVIASYGAARSTLWSFIAGFSIAGLLWTTVFAYAAATLRRFGDGLVRGVSLVSAVLFLYFAVRVFLEGLLGLGSKV